MDQMNRRIHPERRGDHDAGSSGACLLPRLAAAILRQRSVVALVAGVDDLRIEPEQLGELLDDDVQYQVA